jgi:hypothetical protein
MLLTRSQVHQRLQMGLEITPGTPVAANKRLMMMYGMPRPRTPVTVHRPANNRFNMEDSRHHEFSELPFTSALGFNDLLFPLNAIFGAGVSNVWKMSPDDATFPKTFTIQHGSASGAEALAFAFCRDLSFRFSLTEASFSGSFTGRKLDEAAVMTASPTEVPRAANDYFSFDVYMGDAVGSLTKLAKCRDAGFGIGGWNSPDFYFDSTQDSFNGITARAPDLTASVLVVHDADSKALMADLRARTTKFCRLIATGPEYGVGTPYRLTITYPFRFDSRDTGENEGAMVAPYTLHPWYDSTFGGAFEIKVETDYVGP